MKAKAQSTPAKTALIVGARMFLFAKQVQRSNHIRWWGAARNDGQMDVVPAGLKLVLVRTGLARKKEAEDAARQHGAELIEFTSESETFPALQALLGIEADPTKEKAVPAAPAEEEEAEAIAPAADSRLMTGLIIDVPVSRICPMPGQPRTYFNGQHLRALARSIQRAGQRVPIIVVPAVGDSAHDYQIKDGERRWRAAQIIHKPTLRAIVEERTSDAAMFKQSAVCNFGREEHTPLEVALAIKRIRESEHLTLQEVGDIFGRTNGWVSQHVSLLRLDARVQARLSPDLPDDQRLGMSYAVALVSLPTERQEEAAQYILKHRLNLYRARHYVQTLIAKYGHSGQLRKHGPGEEYRGFARYLESTLFGAIKFLTLPKFTVGDVVRATAKTRPAEVVAKLDVIIGKLQRIKAAIKPL
jgi:ParB/RepB/Spo0J family partition protein